MNNIIQGHRKRWTEFETAITLKSTKRIYTFGVLKCSEKFKVLDLP